MAKNVKISFVLVLITAVGLHIAFKPNQNRYYLLATMINTETFEPVITKNCIEFELLEGKSELDKTAENMKYGGFICERNPETLVYNCMQPKGNVIGKIALIKDQKECQIFPQQLAKNLKTLMGK